MTPAGRFFSRSPRSGTGQVGDGRRRIGLGFHLFRLFFFRFVFRRLRGRLHREAGGQHGRGQQAARRGQRPAARAAPLQRHRTLKHRLYPPKKIGRPSPDAAGADRRSGRGRPGEKELRIVLGPAAGLRRGRVGQVFLTEPGLATQSPEPRHGEVHRLPQREQRAGPGVAPLQVGQLMGQHPAQRLVGGRLTQAGRQYDRRPQQAAAERRPRQRRRQQARPRAVPHHLREQAGGAAGHGFAAPQ